MVVFATLAAGPSPSLVLAVTRMMYVVPGLNPPVCRYSQVCSSAQSCFVHLDTEIYSIPGKKEERKGSEMSGREGGRN